MSEHQRAAAERAADDGCASALRDALGLLQALEASLQDEMAALAAGTVEHLLAAAEKKHELLQAIERLVREHLGGRADAQDLAHEHAASWQAMLEQLERCRNLNQAAGGAIAAARRNNDFALSLLGHPSDPLTYGSGSRPTPPGSRDLGFC